MIKPFAPPRPQKLLILAIPAILAAASVQAMSQDQSSRHEEGLRENRPAVWALVGATLVASPESAPVVGNIVVRDGMIEAAGSDAIVPPDARIVKLEGRTIYAGLIDAYSETKLSTDSLTESAGYWNNQVTPQLSVAHQYTAAEAELKTLREQGITARLLAPSDGIIRGTSALFATRPGDANEVLIAADVAQSAELTVPRRDREQNPNSPMGAVALARQAMYDAQWYQQAQQAFRNDPSLPRPESNNALAALRPVVGGSQPLLVETSNEAFVLRAHRFAGEFGLRLIVQGSGNEYRRLEEIRSTGRHLILPVNFPKPPNVATPANAQNATLESLMHWHLAPENAARVHDAGIPFSFSTSGLKSKKDFLSNIRKAVKRGLSESAALQALTTQPALMFGVEKRLGRIGRGYAASLIVTDGSLFDSETKILETWVDGIRFEHQEDQGPSLAGEYELRVQKQGKYPAHFWLTLKQDGDKITGSIRTTRRPAKKDDEAKSEQQPSLDLKKAELDQNQFSASFSATELGSEGIVRLAVLFPPAKGDANESADDALKATAVIVWPEGTMSRGELTQIAAAEEKEKDEEKDKSDDDDAKDDAEEYVPPQIAVNYPLGAFGRSQIPEQVAALALTNATVWTCGPEGTIRNATVLIGNGVILEAGRKVRIPEGVPVIDLGGRHISPGIIDCHSHMATDGGVNESGQAVTAEVRIGDFVDADDITIYRQLAGGVTAASILHGSANPIGGQNQVIKLRWGMTGEEMKFRQAPPGIKFALGENVKQSNWGDEFKTRYPQTRMGVEQIFRDSFTAAKEYGERWDRWQTDRRGLPPRRDLELDAILEIVRGERWIHCHSYRQDEILALIRLLDEFEITIGTFQHILEGYKVADAMAAHGAMGSAFSDWWAYKFEVTDAIPYAGALMHQAGVVVSFNSDDGELGRHLNQEAAKAVKYGNVPPEEALKFVTLNPARQLRIDQYVGSIEPGKQADFVVWSASPLSNYARCEQTWIDGRKYFDVEEDHALRGEATRLRHELIQAVLRSGETMRSAGEDDDDPAALWPRHDEYCHAHGDHDDHHADHKISEDH